MYSAVLPMLPSIILKYGILEGSVLVITLITSFSIETIFKRNFLFLNSLHPLGDFPNSVLIPVDVVGTLDECRFTYESIPVSKEMAREFYRKTEWYRNVKEAKRTAADKGVEDWRILCKSKPPHLDLQLKLLISEIYMATANALINSKFFDVPSLAEVIGKYKEYSSKQ